MNDAELDRLIERRARGVSEDRAGQERADALAEMWAESDRRFQFKRRMQLNAEWFRWHSRLAEHFGRLASEHEAKANALLEGNEPKGAA